MVKEKVKTLEMHEQLVRLEELSAYRMSLNSKRLPVVFFLAMKDFPETRFNHLLNVIFYLPTNERCSYMHTAVPRVNFS